jgi:intein-encoded DNA endonuclease-like protein
MIKLRVTDKDFAEEFARCAGVVLKRKPFRLWWNPRRSMWHVEINSIMLFKFLLLPFEKIKPFTEHCDDCASAFLRAFFDGEGSATGGIVKCSNTNLRILHHVRILLSTRFDIESGRPSKSGPPPGTKIMIKGTLCNVNKQCYSLRLRKGSNRKFLEKVGFTIFRKQARVIT